MSRRATHTDQTIVIPSQVGNLDNTYCHPPPVPAPIVTCVLRGPGRFIAQAGLFIDKSASFLYITMESFMRANVATIKAAANVTTCRC